MHYFNRVIYLCADPERPNLVMSNIDEIRFESITAFKSIIKVKTVEGYEYNSDSDNAFYAVSQETCNDFLKDLDELQNTFVKNSQFIPERINKENIKFVKMGPKEWFILISWEPQIKAMSLKDINLYEYFNQLKCPYCEFPLMISGLSRLESTSEHVLDPNGIPSLKHVYQCQNKKCKAHIFDDRWSHYGECYITTYRKNMEFLAPYNSEQRKIDDADEKEKKFTHKFFIDDGMLQIKLYNMWMRKYCWELSYSQKEEIGYIFKSRGIIKPLFQFLWNR